MTGPELRTRRLRLGRSRTELAHAVGVESDILVGWEEGGVAIDCPHAVEQVLHQFEETRTDRQMAIDSAIE